MSELPETGDVPQWDLADRMRKGLRQSGVSVSDMAAYLGVSAKSVSNWINGRITPSKQTLRLWAMRTGTPYEWLRDGEAGTILPGPGTRVSAGQSGRTICSSSQRIIRFINLSPIAERRAA